MAIDKGGLHYGIRVTDGFSANLTRFKDDIREARREWAALRRSMGRLGRSRLSEATKANAKATRDQQEATDRLSDASRRLTREERSRLREVRLNRAAVTSMRKEEERLETTRRKNVQVDKATNRERLGTLRSVVAYQQAFARLRTEQGKYNIAAKQGINLDVEKLNTRSRTQRVEADEARTLQKVADAELLRERATRSGNRALRERAGLLTPRERAQDTFNKDLDSERQRRRLLELRGTSREYRKLRAENKKLADNLNGTTKRLNRQAGAVNRVSFTFRRLFGILAAFAAARAGIQGFFGLVRTSIEFNSQLEQARLGMAALLTAAGDVRNAVGDAVPPAERLALAQQEARRQVELLRRDALRTSATFEQLSFAFQTAIAPGLQVGFDINQIRQFSVRISQAAAAIGLEQSQLAEEIRSILQGTIQARQTRIAVSLGITNEDIRRAKEAGDLAEFLQAKFKAFEIAGEEALKTFSARLTNAKDAVAQLVGVGAISFFEEIKELLDDIRKGSQTEDSLGLTPNPAAVQVVRVIAEGLRSAVADARAFVKALDAPTALAAAIAVKNAFIIAGKAITAAATGFVKGVGDIGRILNSTVDFFAGAVNALFGTNLDTSQWQQLLELSVRVLVAWVGLSTAGAVFKGVVGGVVSTVGLLAKGFSGVLAVVNVVRTAMLGLGAITAGALLLPFIKIIAIGGALVLLFNTILESVFGIEVHFGQVFHIVKVALPAALRFLGSLIVAVFRTAFNTVQIVIEGAIKFIVNAAVTMLGGLLSVVATVSDTAAEAVKSLREYQDAFNKKSNNKLARDAQDISDAWSEVSKNAKAAQVNIGTAVTKAATDPELKTGFAETIKDELSAIQGTLAQTVDIGLNKELEGSETLLDVFNNLPPAIRGASASLREHAQILKRIQDDARKAQSDLAFTQSTLGLEESTRQQLKIVRDAQFQASEDTRQAQQELVQSQIKLVALQRTRENQEGRIASLSDEERKIVESGINNVKQLLSLRKRIADADQRIVNLQFEAKRAAESGDSERLAEAKRVLEAEKGIRDALVLAATAKEDRATNFEITGSEETQERLKKLITDTLKVTGQERQEKSKIKDLQDAILKIERDRTNLASQRLQIYVAERAEALRTSNQILDQELANEKSINAARRTNDPSRVREAELKASIRLQKLEIQQQKERFKLSQQAASKQAFEALGRGDIQTAAAGFRLLIAEQDEFTKKTGLAQEAVKGLAHELEELQLRRDGSFNEGFTRGLENFRNEYQSIFETGEKFAGDALSGIGSTIGQGVADSLDPTQNVDFAERIRGLGRQLIGGLVENLVNNLLANLIGLILPATSGLNVAASGLTAASAALDFAAVAWAIVADQLMAAAVALGIASATSGGGLAKGGKVPHSSPYAQGLARGGKPRHIPASDTIPAWLTPGEFVIRKDSVSRYGTQFLSALNRGMLDPSLLRSLSHIRPANHASPRPVAGAVGFNDGGQVPSSKSSGNGGGTSTIVQPVMVTDSQGLERMVSSIIPKVQADARRNPQRYGIR